MKNLIYLTLTLAVMPILSQCSPYAGTNSDTTGTSIGYGRSQRSVVITKEETDPTIAGAPIITTTAVATYIVGYIFSEVDEAVTKARTGDYGRKGVSLQNTGGFPDGGFLVITRTIKDSGNKFSSVATVSDFKSGKSGTIGGDLLTTIASTAKDSKGNKPSKSEISKAFSQALKGTKAGDSDKIALLALCPLMKLEGNSGATVYAIGLDGIYYPLLGASRFGIESPDLARRIAKSKESMTLEIYGPNGSGFTTGVAKIPLVWNPPGGSISDSWLTSKELLGHLYDDAQQKNLRDLLVKDAEVRLTKRQAFIKPSERIRPLLRADFQVSETSEATGWIKDGIDSLEKEAKGLVN